MWVTVAPVPVMVLVFMFPMLVGKVVFMALVLVGPVSAVLALVPVVVIVVPGVVDSDLNMRIVRCCADDSGSACRKGCRQEYCCHV